jgi:hypothetical protein
MGHPIGQLLEWREVFASCAIEGFRSSEVCGETLGRLLDGQPVSDRYLLGLAWVMRTASQPAQYGEKTVSR